MFSFQSLMTFLFKEDDIREISVLTAASMKMAILYGAAPCSLIEIDISEVFTAFTVRVTEA
jgi:hypothetical protein